MHFNDTFECMPVDELKKLQLKYLKEVTSWVYERVPFYKTNSMKKGSNRRISRASRISPNFLLPSRPI